MRPSEQLKIDLDRLESIRFATLDQNPHGIRDTLWSAQMRMKEMERVLYKLRLIADPIELQEIQKALGETR